MRNKSLIIKYSLSAVLAVLLVVIDQLTKAAAVKSLVRVGASKEIIKGVINFTYVQNRGAAFGMMQGEKILFIIVTVAVFAAAFLYFKKYRPTHILVFISAALILSGAVGNLIDRVSFGYVRDFIDAAFINFPVFNVADCAICVGAGLVILYAFIGTDRADGE